MLLLFQKRRAQIDKLRLGQVEGDCLGGGGELKNKGSGNIIWHWILIVFFWANSRTDKLKKDIHAELGLRALLKIPWPAKTPTDGSQTRCIFRHNWSNCSNWKVFAVEICENFAVFSPCTGSWNSFLKVTLSQPWCHSEGIWCLKSRYST